MTASVARASPAPFIYFRPERSPFIIKQAQSVAGRLAMLFLAGALLRPFTELWIVTVLAAAGASFTSRRYGPAVTALATLAAFALAPNWYGLKAPMAFAHNAGLTDWLTPELRWGPPAIVLAFAALFLGAVRSGRATFIARHPISSLLGVFAALVVAAIEAPLGSVDKFLNR